MELRAASGSTRHENETDMKETFKQLLIQHKGDATHPEVHTALKHLVRLAAMDCEEGDNRTQEYSPAHSIGANKGLWRSITAPPFPGKLPSDTGFKSRFMLGCM